MLIQKELEAKVMQGLLSAFGDTLAAKCRVTGAWQPVTSGLARWIETDDGKPACVNVSVGTPSRSTHSDPATSLSCKVTLFVRYELDLTGELLVSLSEKIQQVLDAWQGETYQREFDRFDITGFDVGDISISEGSSPVLSDDKVIVEWPFAFSGFFNS